MTLSEQHLEAINQFVPCWFTEALNAGKSKAEIIGIIKENLCEAYRLTGKKPRHEIGEQAEDLYITYMEAIKEHTEQNGHDN